jgi:hypothetical protein
MMNLALRMVMMVIALFIGAAGLRFVEGAWLSMVQQRMEDVRRDGSSYLPPSQPVVVDFSKTQEWLDSRPQIDTAAASRAGFESQFREMQLRNHAAEVGAPQIANGIPTMPGQGVPLQFYHPPGSPFH